MSLNFYRVLIVDDEYYFRQLLIRLIDWKAIGFVIEKEAENGLQALELARQEHYDLIIADINMPGMTGLDFVEALRSAYIDTKVIFITSYDIFEYAQEAISLGASYYLLKPVDEDELLRAVKEIREELIQESETSQYIDTIRKQLEHSKPILRDQFVRQFLLDEPAAGSEILHEQARYYQISMDAGAYMVVIVEIDELTVRFSKEQERQLWRFAVKNVLKETLESAGAACTVIDGENNQIIILTGWAEPNDSLVYSLCEQARAFIDQRMHLRATLVLGQWYEALNQVYLSYSEAVYVLKHKFIKGGNQVMAYTQDHVGSEDAVFSLQLDRAEWLTAIRLKNRDAVKSHINGICERLIENRAKKEIAWFVVMECISIGSAAILERGGTLPSGWMSDRHPLFKQIYGLETVSGIQQWLDIFFDQLVFGERDLQLTRNKGSEIVRNAIEYINKHFCQEAATLQEAARNLSVNPSYLSHIFKKETGKSFTEYLSDLRLDKAMDLLGGIAPEGPVSFKIVDISQKVGYADPYYFSKCFKKKFGVVPSKMIQP